MGPLLFEFGEFCLKKINGLVMAGISSVVDGTRFVSALTCREGTKNF